MKKIYESPIHGYDDTGEVIRIYTIEDEDEFWEIDAMTHEERCELIGVTDESLYPYAIPFGVTFRSYDFDLSCQHLVVHEEYRVNW